jgi:predicted nucleotidyltransferase
MKREEILQFLALHKDEMENRFGVTKMGLVGSFARGEADETSDIDIVVEITSNNKFRSFFHLLYFLEESLHRKVDLAIESSLKAVVKKNITKDILYV